MSGPLQGIRVVELGFWVAGPACAAILADWGADVVKLERPTGDPFRGIVAAFAGDVPNAPFELDNRNKRSLVLDLATVGGREVACELLAASDVFVTNLRPALLERYGLDYETLHARCPRLVYASVTGYGLAGPDRDRPAYDIGAFWSRAGVAAALTPEGRDLPYQRGGMGDHMAGLAAAGGVCAALLAREQTGEGQMVATSLLRIGTYMLGWDTNINLRLGLPTMATTRTTAPNPLINAYTAGDGRRFWMLGLEGDRHWPDVVRALDRPEWADDARFADLPARMVNAAALVAAMDEVLAKRPLAEWEEIFDREGVWWAPVQATHEAIHDPQTAAAGAFVDVPLPDGGSAAMVATPVDFSGTPWTVRAPVPELGQHTEEILLEMGRDWDDIARLKDAGVIP